MPSEVKHKPVAADHYISATTGLFFGILFRLLLLRKVKAAVLDRLGDVLYADFFRAVEIRDGSGHAQDPVMASGGE